MYNIEVSRDSICAADDAYQAFSAYFEFDEIISVKSIIEHVVNANGFREIVSGQSDPEIWELVVNEYIVAKVTTIRGRTEIDVFIESTNELLGDQSLTSFRFVRKINEMRMISSKLDTDRQKSQIERSIRKYKAKTHNKRIKTDVTGCPIFLLKRKLRKKASNMLRSLCGR